MEIMTPNKLCTHCNTMVYSLYKITDITVTPSKEIICCKDCYNRYNDINEMYESAFDR